MDQQIVGLRFEDLSDSEMNFVTGGDGIAPMSTPALSLPWTTYIVGSYLSAVSGAAVSWVASAFTNCA
ncbi:lichenicidin A2 family type 2 lantibiotic [Eggerthella timonensis]|uniref:lichenicidin A2 family type 2 lantibiotic n=1 Tax=Eggerthella timonensis TaxID=1871008 RepID=UPI000C790C10|nr:lichenicidin A2 family type 2 lantibiotic [Eggerthella timonensis]